VAAVTLRNNPALEPRRRPGNIPGMDQHRTPPVLDMTPDGQFRDEPGLNPGMNPGMNPGAPPNARPATTLDRILGKVTGVALLVALAAGGLLLASLAILFVGLVLPVLIVAGAIGAGTLWWRIRRLRRQGVPVRFVVVRR
jgi:hypothetical protein